MKHVLQIQPVGTKKKKWRQIADQCMQYLFIYIYIKCIMYNLIKERKVYDVTRPRLSNQFTLI